MQIAVCDDETLHREHTAALAQKELQEYSPDIECFDSAEKLLLAMSAGDYIPDIAVLDIQMKNMDGISLAKKLNAVAPGCRIIFLTSFLSYATEVYSTEHVYFVIKDEVKKRLGEALRKAASTLSPDACRPAVILATGKQAVDVVYVDSVLYLERRGRKTIIVTELGEHVVSAPPAELLRGSIEGFFIRCHQSFWVNKMKIASLRKDEFALKNDIIIPISRGYRLEAKQQFFRALSAR